MEKAKVLFVAQEIMPYLKDSHMGDIGRHLPQGIQEKGKEIRTFMPRYGNINERRNQLHEVIRLSGMNLIIDDTDHPLIIKVASIQQARMQIYFIDNEDYFQRKFMLTHFERFTFWPIAFGFCLLQHRLPAVLSVVPFGSSFRPRGTDLIGLRFRVYRPLRSPERRVLRLFAQRRTALQPLPELPPTPLHRDIRGFAIQVPGQEPLRVQGLSRGSVCRFRLDR
jgi:hypothetical protein